MYTKAEATKLGRDLVKRLGPDWKLNVWENLGWHFSAVSKNGFWKIHAIRLGRTWHYSAFLGPWREGGVWVEDGKTPQGAYRKTLNVARRTVAQYAALISELPAIRPEKKR